MHNLFWRVMTAFLVSAALALFALIEPIGLFAQATNGITSPAAGEVVSGLVEVQGRAELPDFRRIEVYLIPAENEQRTIWVGQRGSPTVDTVIMFDTNRYPDGNYTLRMRVVRQNRNYEEYHTPIEIRNAGMSWEDRNGITGITPSSRGTVAGPIRITGIAHDPLFSKWELYLLRFRDADRAILLSESTSARLTSGVLIRVLDTAQFPDGEHALRLRVHRSDHTYQDYVAEIIIDNTRERVPTHNGILEPVAGDVLSCVTRVFGVAEHPQFRKWQLDILPAGDGNAASFLNWNDIPRPSRGALVTLDTTRFADGEYTLRLRVVHSNMNYEEYSVPIVIDNHAAGCE